MRMPRPTLSQPTDGPTESPAPAVIPGPASWAHRLRWCPAWLAGVGTTAVLYALGGLMPQAPHVLPVLALDRLIGFHPGAVWLYLSFFGLQALGFCLVPDGQRRALTTTFMVCAGVAALVFLVFPTTLVQPPLDHGGIGLALVRWFDTPANCLPSLHAALSAVSAIAIGRRRQRWLGLGVWLWAVAICWSAIATRQHLSVDIIAGGLLGCVLGVVFLVRRPA